MGRPIGEPRMDGDYTPSVDLDKIFGVVSRLELKNTLKKRARSIYIKNPNVWKAAYVLPLVIQIEDREILEKSVDYLKKSRYNVRMYFDHLVKNSGRVPEIDELPAEMVSEFCRSLTTGSAWIEKLRKPIPEFQRNLLNDTFQKDPSSAILNVVKFIGEWPECFPLLMREGHGLSYCKLLKIRVRSFEEWLRGQLVDGLKLRFQDDYYDQLSLFSRSEGLWSYEYVNAVQSRIPWLEELINKHKKIFEDCGLGEMISKSMDKFPEKPIRDY